MDAPASTLIYMLAGFIVIFGAMFIYIASLILRFKHLHEDLIRLEQGYQG